MRGRHIKVSPAGALTPPGTGPGGIGSMDVADTTRVVTQLSEAQRRGSLSPEEVTDGLAAIEATFRRPDAVGVCVVDGFGCRIVVERGALEVHDGIGPHRGSRR